MTDAEKSPDAPAPDPIERGLLDLPDFGKLGRGFLSWARGNPASLALLCAVFAVLGFFYYGVAAFSALTQSAASWIAGGWNSENDQQHCWAIIPISILLVLLRWRDLAAARKEPSNAGLWWVGAGVIAFIVGVRCMEGRYTIFALPLLAYGMTMFLFGKAVARIVLFPCVFLLFMTPIGGVVQGTAGLQSKTAKVIEFLSSVFGMRIQTEGAKIISLDGRFEPLEVAGGCSGIRSLMAMLMLAALYAYSVMRSPLRGMILFGSSLLFAILGNFARVFSVVLFARFLDPKIATGLYHDYSGFVFFPVAVLAMVGLGNLLNRDWRSVLSPIPAGPLANAVSQKQPAGALTDDEGGQPSEAKPKAPGAYDY